MKVRKETTEEPSEWRAEAPWSFPSFNFPNTEPLLFLLSWWPLSPPPLLPQQKQLKSFVSVRAARLRKLKRGWKFLVFPACFWVREFKAPGIYGGFLSSIDIPYWAGFPICVWPLLSEYFTNVCSHSLKRIEAVERILLPLFFFPRIMNRRIFLVVPLY